MKEEDKFKAIIKCICCYVANTEAHSKLRCTYIAIKCVH